MLEQISEKQENQEETKVQFPTTSSHSNPKSKNLNPDFNNDSLVGTITIEGTRNPEVSKNQ
jgi:hypothetical protein